MRGTTIRSVLDPFFGHWQSIMRLRFTKTKHGKARIPYFLCFNSFTLHILIKSTLENTWSMSKNGEKHCWKIKYVVHVSFKYLILTSHRWKMLGQYWKMDQGYSSQNIFFLKSFFARFLKHVELHIIICTFVTPRQFSIFQNTIFIYNLENYQSIIAHVLIYRLIQNFTAEKIINKL